MSWIKNGAVSPTWTGPASSWWTLYPAQISAPAVLVATVAIPFLPIPPKCSVCGRDFDQTHGLDGSIHHTHVCNQTAAGCGPGGW